MATPVVVTAYGLSGVTATTTFSATNTLAQAYAYPYEGQAFGVAQVASITPAASASDSAIITATGTPNSPDSRIAVPAATYTVSPVSCYSQRIMSYIFLGYSCCRSNLYTQ
jgi:hypothetical protein